MYAIKADGCYRAVLSDEDLLPGETLSDLIPDTDTSKQSRADVDAERDRRIDAGFTFNGVLYQSRATDRENIAGAAQLGFMAMVAGAQPGDLRWASADSDFRWIAADNSTVAMDAHTVVDFGRTCAGQKQAQIFAARAIKDMTPIPADYTDDKYWPA